MLVGASPGDSWELNTPQLMQYYVKGGPLSHGEHGFILSDANWDPYPLANDVEAFTIALANMDVAISQRMLRFTSTFFTVLPPLAGARGGSDFNSAALMQEIDGLIDPVPPEGSALVENVEDLQAGTRLKAARARRAVADTIDLLAEDLLTGTEWLDMRKIEDSSRSFGLAPTALWTAFRHVVPLKQAVPLSSSRSAHAEAAAFIRSHPAETFYGAPPRDHGPGQRRHIEQ